MAKSQWMYEEDIFIKKQHKVKYNSATAQREK